MTPKHFKVGNEVWIPCEVRTGPFPNERRIYVKLDNSEWFGFVDDSQLQEKVAQGKDYVRATVIGIRDERVVLGIRGQSPASPPIEATSTAVGRFTAIPA